jgi:hypothetical protein
LATITAKIFALLMLLALSVSAAAAVYVPQISLATAAVTILQYLPNSNALGYENSIVQSYRLRQALVANILLSPTLFLQKPWAQSQHHSLAHVIVQSIIGQQQQQQQQFLPTFNDLALVSPAAY